MIGIDEILKKRNIKSTILKSETQHLTCIIGFLELIKTVNPTGRWKLVVVDSLSNKILNSACKMYDILEENVRGYQFFFFFFCESGTCLLIYLLLGYL